MERLECQPKTKTRSSASSKPSSSLSKNEKTSSSNTVAPLVIKINSAGIENEEDQSSDDSSSYASSSSSPSSSPPVAASPNAPPKLSPQGALSSPSGGIGDVGTPEAAVEWDTEEVAPPPEKRIKVKRVECAEEIKFTNRTLTDVRVHNKTVTFVEL